MLNVREAVERDRVDIPRGVLASLALASLAGSVVCLAIAPLLMPESYSVTANAVSESAAQGVEGAWLARLGFLLLGFASIVLAGASDRDWGLAGRFFHRLRGIALIGAAAFSHMPWEDVAYDQFEDFLHSVAAGVVGMGFVVGVFFVALRRPSWRWRAFDAFVIFVSLGISMLMFNAADIAGAMQRFMFGVGYVWYALEAARFIRTPSPDGTSPPSVRSAAST